MPHLRFTRDRRGYEHTFLVHRTGAAEPLGSSILYWFRTPPDIRVGRGPLDGEAIRTIEAAYPHLRFDWPRILEAQPARSADAGTEPGGFRPGPLDQRGPDRRLSRRRSPDRRSRRPDPGGAQKSR